jgi:hypothetical protein
MALHAAEVERWLGGSAWPMMGVALCGFGAEAESVVSDSMLMIQNGPVGGTDVVLDAGTLHDCSKLLELQPRVHSAG